MSEHSPGFDSTYLYHTPHGHVMLCTCCGRYEIAFRHTHVRLARAHFVQLIRGVQSFPVDGWDVESYGVLRLTPEGAPVEIRVKLNRADVQELRELLNGAAAMDELETMLTDVLDTP